MRSLASRDACGIRRDPFHHMRAGALRPTPPGTPACQPRRALAGRLRRARSPRFAVACGTCLLGAPIVPRSARRGAPSPGRRCRPVAALQGPSGTLRDPRPSSRSKSIIGMPVDASPIPPPPVAAAGDEGPIVQPPAVATAVVVVARRKQAAMVHPAKADMATADGKTRVADAVAREVMATDTNVPMAAAVTMPVAAAVPGIGRVMGTGKHQRGRHQDSCGEQSSQHRLSPWPVLPRWQSSCHVALGKPRNVAPAREAVAFQRLAAPGADGRGAGAAARRALPCRERAMPRSRRDRRARQDHPSRCRGDRSEPA